MGTGEAYNRVRQQILGRYLGDDRGLTHSSSDTRVPRFLLNDLTRYWRTVTVDFVYKQRKDNDRKWALRNAKLRMSRKLIFAAGLMHIFSCHLDHDAAEGRSALIEAKDWKPLCRYLAAELARPPLETLAKACVRLNIHHDTIAAIFDNYDRFLGILDDADKRQELEEAHSHEQLRSSPAWKEIHEISHPFGDGLMHLFLRDNAELRDLTMRYGLF